MKKVLIVMLAHNAYNDLIESVKQTWVSNMPSNYTIVYNYNGGSKPITYQEGNKIYSPFPEEWSNIVKKTFDVFEYVNNIYEFDYILRCCCGSYINLEELNKIIETLPDSKCYWGLPLKYENIEYATGSCYIISKDLIPILLSNKNTVKTIIDDVEVGRILSQNGIKLIKDKTRMVSIVNNICTYQYEGYNTEKVCNLEDITTIGEYQFHFQNHVDLMKLIHQKLNKNEI